MMNNQTTHQNDNSGSTPQDDDNESGVSGAVIGGAIGGVLFTLVITISVLIVIFYIRRLHMRKAYPIASDTKGNIL